MFIDDFRTRFPEFSAASDGYVQGYLDAAELQMSPLVWGAKFDEGSGWLAAHLMAITPAGVTAGLGSRDGQSPYMRVYKLRCRLVAGGPATI